MAVLLTSLAVPLTWRELLVRTVKEAIADSVFGLAAQLAYYFFFSLFPALLLLMAIASYFPVQTLVNNVFTALGGFAPPEAISIITDQIKKITEAKPAGLLTVGVAAAIWSSSSAMSAIISTLNNAYDVEEGRPWWRVQLTAISLTLGVAVFILVSFALVIVGPALADKVAGTDAPRPRVRVDLGDSAVACGLRAGVDRYRVDLLLRSRCGSVLGVAHPRIRLRDDALVDSIARIQVLRRQYLVVLGDLRRHRRRHGADALVLHFRRSAPAWRGDERRNRARVFLR
jgi:hypothetical protein